MPAKTKPKRKYTKRIGSTSTASRCRTKKDDYERLLIAAAAGAVVGFLLRGDIFN